MHLNALQTHKKKHEHIHKYAQTAVSTDSKNSSLSTHMHTSTCTLDMQKLIIHLISCLYQAAWHSPLANSHLLHAHLLCGAIRERLERYLKLSSLIISRIPQDTLCDVTKEGLREGGIKEGEEEEWWGEKVMSHISQVLSKFRRTAQ